MKTRKLILFNGPPRCGKDTAAAHVWQKYPNSLHFKLSQPLKDGVKAFFNLSDDDVKVAEANKDEPLDMFFGYTYRQVQISLSEDWGKPKFGQRIFGALAARQLARSPSTMFLCSDSGFDYEATPLIAAIGAPNTLLIRIMRPGCTFANDSRSYITLPEVRMVILHNNGHKRDLYEHLTTVIDEWLSL